METTQANDLTVTINPPSIHHTAQRNQRELQLARSGNTPQTTSSIDWWHTMIIMRHWLWFGMLIWISDRKESVFVRVHMETFGLFKYRNVGPVQIRPNFQKYTRSYKIFATKRSNFYNKKAKL